VPVAQGGPAPARQAIVVGLGAALGVVAILFLIFQADRLIGGTDLDIQIGDGIYRPGPAEELADGIAETGPLLLSDPAEGDRDIILTHVGSDPLDGWYAFAARPLSAPRDCFVTWMADSSVFVDNCDGTDYDEKGSGLPQYPVAIDAEGIITIDLSSAGE
jgi:hypothetical protein